MKMVSATPIDDDQFDFFKDQGKPAAASAERTTSTETESKAAMGGEIDVQAKYEQLVKSGATAISSDMLFGEEEKKASQPDRWSTPAAIQTIGEKLQDLSR